MSKTHNPTWFRYIVENMDTFCKHFPNGVKTLADVPTSGGMENTIIGQLKFEQPLTPGNTDFVYADMTHGQAATVLPKYYPKHFNSIVGSFESLRGDLERSEQLQALALGINSNPPVSIGANATSMRSGKFFEQPLTRDSQIMYIGQRGEDTPGEVPMFQNFDVEYIRPRLSAKPVNM